MTSSFLSLFRFSALTLFAAALVSGAPRANAASDPSPTQDTEKHKHHKDGKDRKDGTDAAAAAPTTVPTPAVVPAVQTKFYWYATLHDDTSVATGSTTDQPANQKTNQNRFEKPKFV